MTLYERLENMLLTFWRLFSVVCTVYKEVMQRRSETVFQVLYLVVLRICNPPCEGLS